MRGNADSLAIAVFVACLCALPARSEYRGRIHFVIVDLDLKRSPAQQELLREYYRGYIPRITVLDRTGQPVYNGSGEVEESKLSAILDASLK